MSKKQRETRRAQFDIRMLEDGKSIQGYAAVFNQAAHGEMIAPGAFKRTLNNTQDIRAYWSHNAEDSKVLARQDNGTLVLEEDDIGLRVWMRPNLDTSWGRDALAAVERGDVNKMSFGFSPIVEMDEIHNGETVRVLKEVRLYEVSLVSEPWYEGTTAQVRNQNPDQKHSDPRNAHSTGRITFWKNQIDRNLKEINHNG